MTSMGQGGVEIQIAPFRSIDFGKIVHVPTY